MKHPEHEDMDIPGLHKDIKAMNGKSSARLLESLDALSKLLDENNKDEKAPEDDTPLGDTGTE